VIKNSILFIVENIIADIVDKSSAVHALNFSLKEKILAKIKNKSECVKLVTKNVGNTLPNTMKGI